MLSSIPPWLQIAGTVGGLLAATFQVAYAIFKLLSIPKLEVILTKEVFFRISDWGENLFAQAVIIARNGTAEIRSVSFDLNKTNTPTKSYPLRVLWFGEKKEGTNPFAENHFFSQSTICFVPKDSPIRPIYLTVVDAHATEIKEELNKFYVSTANLEKRFKAIDQTNQDELNIFFNDFLRLIEDQSSAIFDKIKLEEGKFELAINVSYRFRIIFFTFCRSGRSKIKFRVDKYARTLIKNDLAQTLQQAAKNIVFGKNDPFKYPEYVPSDIEEVSES